MKKIILLSILIISISFNYSFALQKDFNPLTSTVTISTDGGTNLIELQKVSIKQTLTTFEMVMRIRSFVNIVTDDIGYKFVKNRFLGADVKNITVFLEKTKEYTTEVPVFDSDFNITGKQNKTMNYTFFDEITFRNKTLKKDINYTIKITATREAFLGNQSTDITPIIANMNLMSEFAWWNTSYQLCRNIEIRETNGIAKTNYAMQVFNINLTGARQDLADITLVNAGCNNGGNEVRMSINGSLDGFNSRDLYNISFLINLTANQFVNYSFYWKNTTGNQPDLTRDVIFWDNFSSSDRTNAIWTQQVFDGSSVTITGGEAVVAGARAAGTWFSNQTGNGRMFSKLSYSTGFTVSCEEKWTNSGTGSEMGCGAFKEPDQGGFSHTMTGAMNWYDTSDSGIIASTVQSISGATLAASIPAGYINTTVYLETTGTIPLYNITYNNKAVSKMGNVGNSQSRNKAGIMVTARQAGDTPSLNVKWLCSIQRNETCISSDTMPTVIVSSTIEDTTVLSLTINSPTQNQVLLGTTVTTNVSVLFNNSYSITCSEQLDSTSRDLSVCFSCSNQSITSTWTGITTYGQHNYTLTCNNIEKNATKTVNFNTTCRYHINVTFDQPQRNVTLTMINGVGRVIQNLTAPQEFYDCSDNYPIGSMTLQFNQVTQFITFWNNQSSDFQRNATVMDSTNPYFNISVYPAILTAVVTADQTPENALVEAYLIRKDGQNNKSYLVGSGLTGRDGITTLYLVVLQAYEFLVSKEGYNDDRKVTSVQSATQTERFSINKTLPENVQVALYTNCGNMIQTTGIISCNIILQSNINMRTVNITYTINGTRVDTYSSSPSTSQNITSKIVPITISQYLNDYNITAYVNGYFVGNIKLMYNATFLTDRDAQVTVDFTNVAKGDRLIILIIMMTISACLGIISNKIAIGTGIYVFGITMGIMGSMAGIAGAGLGGVLVSATAIGLAMIIAMSRKVIK